jgi:hypothetical protein
MTGPELVAAIRQRWARIKYTVEFVNRELADYDDSMANDLDFAVAWLGRAADLLSDPARPIPHPRP